MSQARIALRDDRKKRWFWIDNQVFNGYGAQMQPSGIAVYCALARHANNDTAKSWPAMRTIAGEIGVSTGVVRRAITRLEELKLIAVERPGAPQPNVYVILESPMCLPEIHDVAAMCPPETHHVSTIDTELDLLTKQELKEEEEILFEDLEGHPQSISKQPKRSAVTGYDPSVADPSKESPDIEELARQLAPPIDWVWDYDKATNKALVHAAKDLLVRCKGGDIDDVLAALDAYLEKNGDWARENISSPMGLITLVARQFQKMQTAKQRQSTARSDWAEHAEKSQAALAERRAEAVEITGEDLWWEGILRALQGQMTIPTFDACLRDTTLLKHEGERIVVGVPNEYAQDWLENRLLPIVKRTVAADGVTDVAFRVI